MAKTFILGVGAQRCGTTWLHRYLVGHPNVDMGFTKEYHIFDALFIPEAGIRSRYLQRRIEYLLQDTRPRAAILLGKFLSDPQHYFDYFNSLCSNSEIFLTGDITPSYSGLPVEALEEIKCGLQHRGFNVRVLFLMRDPVERCLSAVRMEMRNARVQRSAESEEQRLAMRYNKPGFQLRSRYDQTMQRVEQVFSPGEIHYEFYEELFSESATAAISEFLCIPYRQPDFKTRVNASRTENVISEKLKREIFVYYRDVYTFVASRFGAGRIAALWPTYSRFA